MQQIFSIQTGQNESLNLSEIIQKELKFSKEKTEKLIFQGSVWNDKRNLRLKNKDQIISNELIFLNVPEFPINEYTLDINNIKYEDDEILIVYKEPGINTCQTPFSDIDCLTSGIQKYYNKKKIDYTVFTINRLDKPTKGLVFYAKNKKVEIQLHQMFKNRKVKKLYLALTPKFEISKNEFIFSDKLTWKNKIQEAASYVKFIKEKDGFYYFVVYPMTGRTHQIRKHFKSYLHPIVGDALYGGYSREDEMELTCFKYIFNHPVSEKRIEVEFIPEKYKC